MTFSTVRYIGPEEIVEENLEHSTVAMFAFMPIHYQHHAQYRFAPISRPHLKHFMFPPDAAASNVILPTVTHFRSGGIPILPPISQP